MTIRDARDVADEIVRSFSPVSVVLFGSVAKEGVGGDLDLLVIVDDATRLSGNPELLLYQRLKNFYKRFSIDPFIIPLSLLYQCYHRGSPFLNKVLKEGRVLYMRDAVREWFKNGEDELRMAEYLMQGGYFKGACYHAQQSAEKAVKARLLQKGWELEKTHSIERLVSIAEEYNIAIDISEEDMVFIDSIYRGRYPLETGLLPLGEPLKEDAERAVGIARRICADALKAMT